MGRGKKERNKCHCGSGKRFRNCHGAVPPVLTPEALATLKKKIERQQARQHELASHGIYIRLVEPITHEGKRVFSTGNGIMFDGNEHTTFHELLMRDLQRTMGRRWWEAEKAKPVEGQHFIMQCYGKLGEFFRNPGDSLIVKGPHRRGAYPNGYVQSIMNLAFDIHILRQTLNRPPNRVLERLRNRDQFQGAAYEISVASLFTRIGCRLEYFNEHTAIKRLPEFTASLPETGDEVVVEAKSKHRHGVLHLKGTLDLDKERLLKAVQGYGYIPNLDSPPGETP